MYETIEGHFPFLSLSSVFSLLSYFYLFILHQIHLILYTNGNTTMSHIISYIYTTHTHKKTWTHTHTHTDTPADTARKCLPYGNTAQTIQTNKEIKKRSSKKTKPKKTHEAWCRPRQTRIGPDCSWQRMCRGVLRVLRVPRVLIWGIRVISGTDVQDLRDLEYRINRPDPDLHLEVCWHWFNW